MKFTSILGGVVIAAVFSLGISIDAQAKRLGGGKSMGKQSYSQGQAAPSQGMSKPAAPAPTGAQPSRFGGMGGILGGIAAGVGLSMLLSHFGMGEAAASFFSTMLIVMAIVMVGLWLIRRFAGSQLKTAYNNGPAAQANTYRVQPEAAPISSSSAPTKTAWEDQEAFLQQAKKHFIELQEASDKQDLEVLKGFTSPALFEELRADLLSRDTAFSQTQVLTLNAELLAAETEQNEYVASVKFSGLIREEKDAPAVTFEEIWNWTKPLNNQTGWVLAGIQQLS
jgi:predicted lipid-binding transport protein (Tim44 family)